MRLVLLLLVLLASCHVPAARRVPHDALASLFATLHAGGHFDGAVVVGTREQILFEHGYDLASVEPRAAFTPETPTDGGSLAKPVTAAIVLELVAEGRLALDAPIERLVPELASSQITMRHLLSHSSGLPSDYGVFDAFVPPDAVRTTERLLQALAEAKLPLAFPPGTRFEYASFGYDVAALAAARAVGTTVETLFAERVFRRHRLASAFLRPGRFSEWRGVRTRGYRRTPQGVEPHDVFDLEAFHGGSNMYISARDLHRWNVAQLAATGPALERATIAAAPSGLTLGSWYREDDGSAFWYSGHLQGFHTEVYRDVRRGLSIVIAANNTLDPWLHHTLVRAVRDVVAGRAPESLEPPPLAPRAKLDKTTLVGRWRTTDGELAITSADETLVVAYRGVYYGAFPVSATSFYVPGIDLLLGFSADATHKLFVSSKRGAGWATRASP